MSKKSKTHVFLLFLFTTSRRRSREFHYDRTFQTDYSEMWYVQRAISMWLFLAQCFLYRKIWKIVRRQENICLKEDCTKIVRWEDIMENHKMMELYIPLYRHLVDTHSLIHDSVSVKSFRNKNKSLDMMKMRLDHYLSVENAALVSHPLS